MARTKKTTATTATTASTKEKTKKMNSKSKVENISTVKPDDNKIVKPDDNKIVEPDDNKIVVPNTNKAITDIMAIKDTITVMPDGTSSITYDGITVNESDVFSDIKLPKISGIIFNEKANNIKNHCEKLDKYAKMAKISTIYIGRELYAIQQDGSYKELGLTSFEQFYTKLELPKSTTYHYITGFLMVCDCFGEIDEKALAVGEATAYKAKRLGMTNVEFREIVHKADENGIQITTANLIDKATEYGVEMDAEKVAAERKKESRGTGKGKGKKVVKVLPSVENDKTRFMRLDSKTDYVDIAEISLQAITPDNYDLYKETIAERVITAVNKGFEEKDKFTDAVTNISGFKHNIYATVTLFSPIGRIWVYTYSEHISTPTSVKAE